MMMNKYKRFDETAWHEFGKTLLAERGSDEQKDFLNSCMFGKEEFLRYVEENLPSKPWCLNGVIGSTNCTLVLDRQGFSEKEFVSLSEFPENEQIIWGAFKDADDAVYSYGFWGYVTLDMIKKSYIKPVFLARSGNGVKTIDKALKGNDDKEIDSVVRRILRSMCNSAPRGKRVIFNECYLGKSYWRWHWAEKMSQHIPLSPEEIRDVLTATCYSSFSAKMHSGKSYIGSKNVLGGLLLYLEKEASEGSKKLEKIINQISYLSAWKAIEMQSAAVNQTEIQQIAKNLP